jgi:Spy/CpxP family protein refolding chaperone
MRPEQREKWEKIRTDRIEDTLELGKQLVTWQMELETLWAQPDVDEKKVEKLSNKVADLQSQLWKKRDQYLMRCPQGLGDHDWACPGGWR